MGRILLLEPQPEIRELVTRVATRLGHKAFTTLTEDDDDFDAVVLEPQSERGLALARKVRGRLPELPLICISVLPLTPELRDLEPDAFLMKPFSLSDLELALGRVLAGRPGA